MFTTYASILALATAVLSAPLANPACGAGVPVVTVTTYVTGYPPAAASSTSVAAPPSPTPGAFYENVNPNPAKPNPPTTLSTLTTSSSPVAPPPPPATYEPAPNPPKTTTTKAPNPEPTYGASPPPPPPPPPPPKTNNPPPQSGSGNKGTKSMTPHDKYSSSIGVVGCKVNTNRIAYWPERPVISRYCVKVTHGGQSLHLLHIDQSEGANDMSYDAWNVLVSGGKSATESPHCGGGVDMEYEWVDNSECADLILDGSGKLPLIATNPEFCLGTDNPDQYVTLWNFKDLRCEMGVDEQCKVPDYKAGLNQAICPSGLGVSSAKTDCAVKDIPYVNTPTCAIAS